MEVRKIMTKNPACCTADSTLQEVAHMMEMYDCGCIPVVGDHKTGQPIGTITDRDIAVRTLGAGKNPSEMTASDIMTTDVATVSPDTTVEQCRDVMENRQIRRILVVDKTGRCVGIVAQADLVVNESNARQTAEFIRDVSQPKHSTARNDVSSERESYQDFSNQNRGYEQNFSNRNRENERNFSRNEENRSRSFSEQTKKTKRTRKQENSFFGGSFLLPLAIGVGAGAALKYFMPASEKSQTTFVPRERVTSSVHTDKEETPVVLIEVPTETIENNFGTIGKTTTATKSTETLIIEDDADTTTEIGRTARL